MTRVRGHGIGVWLALVTSVSLGACVDGMSGGNGITTDAERSDAVGVAPAAKAGNAKAMPVKPPAAPGVSVDGTLPAKPAASAAVRERMASVTASAAAWSVSLTASQTSLWPMAYATLTATTNMDVGPTPYYIRIWDPKAASFLATCGSGTTCSVAVSRDNADLSSFTARVVDGNGIIVASMFETVSWHGGGLKFVPAEPTLPIAGTMLLSAVTDFDISPTPFYIQLFDVAAGTTLATCGTGTGCVAAVRQTAAATRRFRACLTAGVQAFPPTSFLECTDDQFVTWSDTTGDMMMFTGSSDPTTLTVTAVAPFDVGPTPYYIQLYSLDGRQLTACGSGTTCSTTFSVTSSTSPSHSGLVGFVATWQGALTDIVAAAVGSNVLRPFGGGAGSPLGPGPHSPPGPIGDPSPIILQ